MMLDGWIPSSPTERALLTLLFVGGVLVAYRLAEMLILARGGGSRAVRRRWIVTIRNVVVFVVLLGVVTIWFDRLRALGTALAVIAAAVAIATKEFWLNLIGYVFRSMSRAFSIGDRIKIGDFRGDVIDLSMMGVTVLEVGPGPDNHQYTGRTVFVPNSLFMVAPLINETFMKEFVFHIVRVPLRASDDWRGAERRLLEAALHASAPYLERARRHMHAIERQHSLTGPTVQPHVKIHLPDSDSIHLLLRLPVPARRRSAVEQAVLRRYLGDPRPAVDEHFVPPPISPSEEHPPS